MATDLDQLTLENGVYKIYNGAFLTDYLSQHHASTCPEPKIKITSVIPNDLTTAASSCYSGVNKIQAESVFTMNQCLNELITHYELPTTIGSNPLNQTAKTTKTDFVSLYNEHYIYNVKLFVGITIIGAVLAKMIFYPMKI